MSNRLFPISCTSCGKILNHIYNNEYLPAIEKAKNDLASGVSRTELDRYDVPDIDHLRKIYSPEGLALTNLGINRYCCRRMFLCQPSDTV